MRELRFGGQEDALRGWTLGALLALVSVVAVGYASAAPTGRPGSADMKAVLQAYIDHFNDGDAEAIAALFAEDATVEDPVGSLPRRGRQAILQFYREAMANGARLTLDTPIRSSHGNGAAMAFSVKAGPVTVRVIDVMTFDDAGRIVSMKAYWGPDDMVR